MVLISVCLCLWWFFENGEVKLFTSPLLFCQLARTRQMERLSIFLHRVHCI